MTTTLDDLWTPFRETGPLFQESERRLQEPGRKPGRMIEGRGLAVQQVLGKLTACGDDWCFRMEAGNDGRFAPGYW